MDKLAWLFPTFSGFSTLPFDVQLSSIFIGVLLSITVIFLCKSGYSVFKAWKRISWLHAILSSVSSEELSNKRDDLYSLAKKNNDSAGHLWLEFDETLIEVRKDNKTTLYNTFDAAYFFNSTTLAKGVTDNRLVAAVPGFLTAIGVIGTFVGLQIGLAEMNISADVSIDEMKAGVAAVIGGAKVAFMTSVWGVFLSVIFNLTEKLLEQATRWKINGLQNTIDKLFPRLSAEAQLQDISESSGESRECLQGLAEQIGVKMQESMLTATRGISEALEASLNEIMAPAINKLVDDTSEGNQKALEDLLTKFMDGFGTQGQQQRQAMESASEQVNESIVGMNRTMESFINKMEASQQQSGEREKELISSISLQVSQLVEQGHEQTIKMNDLMNNQLGGLSSRFENAQQQAAQREQELISSISLQVSQLVEQGNAQTLKMNTLMESQLGGLSSNFENAQQQAAQREQALISSISQQVSQLAEQSNEQTLKMNELMEKQLGGLSSSFENGQQQAAQREQELISSISQQVSQLVKQGNEQTIKMNDLMENQLGGLSASFENAQQQAGQREQDLTSNIEQQIKSLTEGISAQSNVLTDFVNKQMGSLQDKFDEREVRSTQLAEQRDGILAKQNDAISATTQDLIQQVDMSIKHQQSSSEQILQQGKSLQQSVESSVLASAKATDSMRESATELKSAADSMNVFGSHVREAGNQLSGAVKEAAETTKDLALQNQLTAKRMESLRDELLVETEKFNTVVDNVSGMISTAGSTFTELKLSQKQYLDEQKNNVGELAKQMTKLLSDYAEQANGQTANHLNIWATSSTQYAESMNSAARALSSVVDEIQDKVGA